MNTLKDGAVNASSLGDYKRTNSTSHTLMYEKHMDEIVVPVESIGLCTTTRLITSTRRVEVPILTLKGKVSKTKKKKYKNVTFKYNRSHTSQPSSLANGYCIDCWDRGNG